MAVFTKRVYPESSYAGTWTDPDGVLQPGPNYATADSAGGQHRYQAYVIRSTIPNDALITAITVGTDADASLVGPSPAALATYDIGQPGARTRIDTTTPVQDARSIESVSMSAAHTAYIASVPGILRDTQITMRARIPPDTTGAIRIYRWWLDVTYEADSSDEVDIYSSEIGMIERPDWSGSWANFDHLISPKGKPASIRFSEVTAGDATGGLIFRSDSFPSSAEIVSVENHFRAKVDLDPEGNQSIGIGSFLAQMPGLESTAPRALVQVRASEFEDYFVSYYGAQLQFFKDNPSFFRYGSLQNYVSRSSLGAVETIYNDQQFLRVRYTYSPPELAASFDSASNFSPDVNPSRLPNLIRNGRALSGDSSNFSQFEYSPTGVPGTGGAFLKTGSGGGNSDDLIPVDTSKRYMMSALIRYLGDINPGGMTVGFESLDVDLLTIRNQHVLFEVGTLTHLTQPLKRGDTTIHVTSTSNWRGDTSSTAGILFWNYQTGDGKIWPPETYTQYAWTGLFSNTGLSPTSIQLLAPWPANRPEFLAGTPISNSNTQGNATGGKYTLTNNDVMQAPPEWTLFSGTISKETNRRRADEFFFGTKYIRFNWLPNRGNSAGTTAIAYLYFGEAPTRALSSTLTASSIITGPVSRIVPLSSTLRATGTLSGITSRIAPMASTLSISSSIDAPVFRILDPIHTPTFSIAPHKTSLVIS